MQRTFRLGAVAGATPGKWIERWREQFPHVPLELVPLTAADQLAAIRTGAVDAAIVRRPLDETALHVVALYDELPVVVMSAESDLTVADELAASDLAGAVLVTPLDDVLGPLDAPGAVPARFAAPETTEEAVAIAASGVGVVVVPMSLARLHHRRDATYRRLTDGPVSPVVLAWPQDGDTDDVQAFVAITRGRTARSSR